jgi:hypothetical protein
MCWGIPVLPARDFGYARPNPTRELLVAPCPPVKRLGPRRQSGSSASLPRAVRAYAR